MNSRPTSDLRANQRLTPIAFVFDLQVSGQLVYFGGYIRRRKELQAARSSLKHSGSERGFKLQEKVGILFNVNDPDDAMGNCWHATGFLLVSNLSRQLGGYKTLRQI
jgi:hypothetical protein